MLTITKKYKTKLKTFIEREMIIKELITKLDPDNQFDVLKDSYSQVEYAWNIKFDLSTIDVTKIKNIIVSGLGGSAIGGELLQSYFRTDLKYPYQVNRNYELPLYANEETLVIASSYSGNTEETISALNDATAKQCQIVCITTGGKIEQIAKENKIPVGILKHGFQPRFALWINFFSLVNVFNTLKIVPEQDSLVKEVILFLKKKGLEYSSEKNEAIYIAENLLGFIPLLYSVSDYTSVVGTRWRGQFNENSKQHAFSNCYPELDHNEIMGWEGYKPTMNFKLINIIDEDYHLQVKKRFEITTEVIKKCGADVINIQSKEKNYKLRLVDMIYLGDWMTYYYALMRGFDPTTIDNINYLKANL
ncbi:MAG: Hexose-6-phosphate isomerase [Ignavibacteria bacterium]|nr:MAG: Hexose-6-phosphate isomerase [Ignavibacteria bacterium]KAF0160340.1 MAG: Hexose-6-phosphate isomerase [Ignavibacteria bacterium]